MRSMDRQVEDFRSMVQSFKKQHPGQPPARAADCAFEFQTFMSNQITEAQKQLSEEHNFDFSDLDNAAAIAEQSGHIASLTNQLGDVLAEVRTMCLGYHAKAGVNTYRKCPHCGQEWVKLEGCDGETTCGNLPSAIDARSTTLPKEAFSTRCRDSAQPDVFSETCRLAGCHRCHCRVGHQGDWMVCVLPVASCSSTLMSINNRMVLCDPSGLPSLSPSCDSQKDWMVLRVSLMGVPVAACSC